MLVCAEISPREPMREKVDHATATSARRNTGRRDLRSHAAIAIFCNEVKGKSALALCRDLGLSCKSAFVLLHKLREAMAEELR